MPTVTNSATGYLDASELIDTFDAEEARDLLVSQLDLLDDDACEILTDNFKLYFTRYASLEQKKNEIGPDLFSAAQEGFFRICNIFIEEISKKFSFTYDEDFLDENWSNIHAFTLSIYLFCVIDLRSNLFTVLYKFIRENSDAIFDAFKERLEKHDSITSINRASIEDATIALISSNVYDVVDWCMEQMNFDIYMENLEKGYFAYAPILNLVQTGFLGSMDAFVDTLRDILRQNVALKARICFDIVCRLKGYDLDS